MQGSTPQHYTIADFLKWHEDGELKLNPKFQRGPVWNASARSYLVDSLLRGYPIPKLLLRTEVNRANRRTVRDVVDGQQRLRTIIDFANDRLQLGSKAGEFQGLRYSDLDEDLQDDFLSYKLTCEQLINASDEDVLEVFVRINSYAVPVNEAELRNARFDNDFSGLVKRLIPQLGHVWAVGVLSNRDRVRMLDQSLVAEILGFLQQGVQDGAEKDITRIYDRNKDADLASLPNPETVLHVTSEATRLLAGGLEGEAIAQRPHFLMLVAAVMYANGVLPPGKLTFDHIPPPQSMLQDDEAIRDALAELDNALSAEVSDLATPLVEFVDARTTTQRMKSRQIRFRHFARALTGEAISL